MEHIKAELLRGTHPSYDAEEATKSLHNETRDKVANGYAKVIRYGELNKNLPEKLKISPVAMIPHKSKSYRKILEPLFQLQHRGKIMQSLNLEMVKHAPPQEIIQLGQCVLQLIATLVENYDGNTRFKFSKLEIKDGVWRLAVSDTDAWNFCYVIPQANNVKNIEDIKVLVKNCLQMGWCESTQFFCAASETAGNVIDTLLHKVNIPDHPFE